MQDFPEKSHKITQNGDILKIYITLSIDCISEYYIK